MRAMSAPPRPQIPKLAELPLAIATEHLRLRPFVETDVEAIWPVVSEPSFPRMMSWAAHTDRDQTLAWVRRKIGEVAEGVGVVWVIEHDGRAAGCLGFDEIEWHLNALRVDRSELGFWLAPALWNKGFMTEAATAVVRFGFETIGLHKITTRCFAENTGSRRVIEKVGFRFVGRQEEDVWRDGKWSTHLAYELTAPEWPDVHTTLRVNRPRPT
jgi:ribosomal-protein-alanine N-acetyltransferase